MFLFTNISYVGKALLPINSWKIKLFSNYAVKNNINAEIKVMRGYLAHQVSVQDYARIKIEY